MPTSLLKTKNSYSHSKKGFEKLRNKNVAEYTSQIAELHETKLRNAIFL